MGLWLLKSGGSSTLSGLLWRLSGNRCLQGGQRASVIAHTSLKVACIASIEPEIGF